LLCVGPFAAFNCNFSSSVISFCFLVIVGFVQYLSKYVPFAMANRALASEAAKTPLSPILCHSASWRLSDCGSRSTGRGVLSASFVGRTGATGSSIAGEVFNIAVFGVVFVLVFAAFTGFEGVSSKASENLLLSPGSALMRADVRRISTMMTLKLLLTGSLKVAAEF
jgi:hypothetical protein